MINYSECCHFSAALPAGMPGGGRRVLPPQVPPDLIHRTQPPPYNHLQPHQQPGSPIHYNSIGQDESFPPPPSPLVPPKSPNRGEFFNLNPCGNFIFISGISGITDGFDPYCVDVYIQVVYIICSPVFLMTYMT